MKSFIRLGVIGALAAGSGTARAAGPSPQLSAAELRRQVAYFNGMEPEGVVNAIPNAGAAAWLEADIPRFDCPDAAFEQIYYFRWWCFRKHIERLADGTFVLSEFITRPKPISSALGHQIYEGRWLRDPRYLDDYIRYWLRGPGGRERTDLHRFSSWLADAVYRRSQVTGDTAFAVGLLDDLVRDYRQWQAERQLPSGLFWQYDVRDAMEESISGSRTQRNVRPTINSYMYGNARAIAALAREAGRPELAAEFDARAERLRGLVQAYLWNPGARFFEVREQDGSFSDVREELGYIPWYFDLPPRNSGDGAAWAQLTDPRGFAAPWGITTAERRSPRFRTHGVGHCEWDGAVWPFATSQTLTGLANELRDYPAGPLTRDDYFRELLTYARSQHWGDRPYIGEYQDETNGRWLKGPNPRSRYYNHSTFADLVITGLAGLRPRSDPVVDVEPLLPPGTWDWFCLDDVPYHGHRLTIVWDRTGTHYGWGRGLSVWADGREVARTNGLTVARGMLPP